MKEKEREKAARVPVKFRVGVTQQDIPFHPPSIEQRNNVNESRQESKKKFKKSHRTKKTKQGQSEGR